MANADTPRVWAIGEQQWTDKVTAAAKGAGVSVESCTVRPPISPGREDLVLLQWRFCDDAAWRELVEFLKSLPRLTVILFPGTDDPSREREQVAPDAGWKLVEISEDLLESVLPARLEGLLPWPKPLSPQRDQVERDLFAEATSASVPPERVFFRHVTHLLTTLSGKGACSADLQEHLDTIRRFVDHELGPSVEAHSCAVREVVADSLETFGLAMGVDPDATDRRIAELADGVCVTTNEGFLLAVCLLMTNDLYQSERSIPGGSIQILTGCPPQVFFEYRDTSPPSGEWLVAAREVAKRFHVRLETLEKRHALLFGDC